jgi:hypothetical protein
MLKYEIVVRDSQGKQTNASDATVHADTGAITTPGLYDVKIIAGCSVAALWLIQFRNEANDGNVGDTHPFYTAAGQSAEFVIHNVPFTKNQAGQTSAIQRVRVVNDGAITGTSSANVFVFRSA